ncbi:AAA family ATPase [Candidatus Nomurabacteria bacterium]|uniref:AAA family ATPase n=1 Tax=Candidatus Dojkabacteria bacterium TaxID=2099670 RepID=A0A955I0B7_9BACT|nr:AAA family ATPase [Candidatus Dojkabacteria bacterium]MCB9789793.1 AAA family ATPase [Candidatus Nomurabacteria bacterium]MCB9803583.1 AAA family ATPase [Candidatus Nomurabacteria bacterium]
MKDEIQLSNDQKIVLDSSLSWVGSKNNGFLTIGGYAGTGKTTLISILRSRLDKENSKLKVCFCSYTGKAAMVLQEKLRIEGAIHPLDTVSTIHSLIYSPVVNDREEIVGWEKKENLTCDLVIIDEASMVDDIIWNDLLSFGIPILAVGDHGQLPPIRGKFALMQEPMLKLQEIHRQAEGNPIIQLSLLARQEGRIPVKNYSDTVRKLSKRESETGQFVEDLFMSWSDDMLVLCGYNNTRTRLNGGIRKLFDLNSPYPEPGDRVICLRNNHALGIYNGMIGTITDIRSEDEDWYYGKVDFGENAVKFKGLMSKEQFNNPESLNHTQDRRKTIDGDLFDFGYAITVHKAQGSQAPKVVLFEERFKQMDDDMWRRWLYTAVTRAESELYIIGE